MVCGHLLFRIESISDKKRRMKGKVSFTLISKYGVRCTDVTKYIITLWYYGEVFCFGFHTSRSRTVENTLFVRVWLSLRRFSQNSRLLDGFLKWNSERQFMKIGHTRLVVVTALLRIVFTQTFLFTSQVTPKSRFENNISLWNIYIYIYIYIYFSNV